MSRDDDELRRLKKEADEIAARRQERLADEARDAARASQLAALQARAAETDRLEKRRREDEERRKQREAEDEEDRRKAAQQARREEAAAGMRKADSSGEGIAQRPGPAPMGMGPAPTGSRSLRGRRLTRATMGEHSPVRSTRGTARRYSPVGIRGRESVASSFDDQEGVPDTATTTTRSHKRSAEGSQRDTSRSESRGGTKRARKMEPLIPGVKCQRCKARHLECVPIGGSSKTCRACRSAKTRCANPSDAGSDLSWYAAARELGADPGPGDRVYGPVASPARGFEDADDHLWGKWLDVNSRIHLQVVDAIDRTNRHLEDHSVVFRDNANAAILAAVTVFNAEAARQRLAGNADYYAMVRRDYRVLTGVDLGSDPERIFSDEVSDDDMVPADGTPHAAVAGSSDAPAGVVVTSDDAEMQVEDVLAPEEDADAPEDKPGPE